jgi:hypothetical protein
VTVFQSALDRTLAQLSLSAGSWGNWTGVWRFAADHNQTFVREQVTESGALARFAFDRTPSAVAAIRARSFDVRQRARSERHFPTRNHYAFPHVNLSRARIFSISSNS